MNPGRREFVLVGVAAVLALVLAAVSTVWAWRLSSRQAALVRNHNELVGKWNAYQAARQKEGSGVGALLDAAGVPGGKIIGDVLDAGALTPEQRAARRESLDKRGDADQIDRRDARKEKF